MEKVAMINKLYFENKLSLTEIAEMVNTSISYISRILKKDERYKKEKEERKQQNLLNRRKVQKELIYSKRKCIVDIDYLRLRKEHIQASKELSKNSVIGKDALRKWCISAYKYNPSKDRYEFKTDELLKPADFPMYIKA